MIFKILGTALTGIGGHYLNRRWDRAALFLSLFVLYGIFCWMVVRTFLFSNILVGSLPSEEMMNQISKATATISIIYLSGIFILWLISNIITIVDGLKIRQVEIFQWTKTGIVAASLTTLLSVALLVFSTVASVSALKPDSIQIASETESEVFSRSSHDFYEYLYFGGSPQFSENLPNPPVGKGVLKGRILYESKPAEGITLHMVLNSKYRAKTINTDSDGFFIVKLPAGNWKINSIQTESWQNKPDEGQFTIYYGGEEKLNGSSYNPHHFFRGNGFDADVGENEDKTHITMTIKRDIELIWPNASVVGNNATISDVIQWRPYPQAEQYYIDIKQLRREGNTTYYDQITSKVLSNETAVPLSSLRYIKTKGKEKHEYAASIYAFSDDGALIGEFTDTFRGGSFKLSDGNVLIEDKLQDMFDSESNEDPEAFEKKMERIRLDRRRVDAVEVMVDENMISEAKTLLELVNSEYVDGRKEVLSGYILALKGKCTESTKMFIEAEKVNPDVCIPKRYREVCE